MNILTVNLLFSTFVFWIAARIYLTPRLPELAPRAALLAVAAIPAVAVNARVARPLVWVFNIEGTVDLIAAIALATVYDAAAQMGPAYWIPAFWVPALLVTHYVTFVVLLKYWKEPPKAAFENGRPQAGAAQRERYPAEEDKGD